MWPHCVFFCLHSCILCIVIKIIIVSKIYNNNKLIIKISKYYLLNEL